MTSYIIRETNFNYFVVQRYGLLHFVAVYMYLFGLVMLGPGG